jgi:hypothetical protein
LEDVEKKRSISLHRFSNESKIQELVVDDIRILLTDERLLQLRNLLLQEYPLSIDARFETATILGVPTEYVLVAKNSPEARSGWSDESRYEYFEDSEGNHAFRIINPSGQRSAFHRLGKIEDPQSRIGRFWAHFPDNRVQKKDLAAMFTRDYQRLKAMIDILVRRQKVSVIVTRSRNGDPILAYERTKKLPSHKFEDGGESPSNTNFDQTAISASPGSQA